MTARTITSRLHCHCATDMQYVHIIISIYYNLSKKLIKKLIYKKVETAKKSLFSSTVIPKVSVIPALTFHFLNLHLDKDGKNKEFDLPVMHVTKI